MKKALNSPPLVSVCVPAYNRPEMMRQLIASFAHQDYPNKELVIADDSPNDSIGRVVKEIGHPEVKYYKNRQNLGYSQNFLEAMVRAKGKYIVMMGDDDLFLSPQALSIYVKAFEEHPEVGYAYSNQVQFSNQLQVEYIYEFFPQDCLFTAGEEAMKGIWTTSIFIPGLAIRNNRKLAEFYPKTDMLFPQLEFVGHMVNISAGYGISEYLIAGRAHNEQLGFYAIKGERIRGTEKHGTVELFTIFQRLAKQYRFKFNDDFMSQNLIDRFLLSMLKERTVVGRARVRKNYQEFCKVSEMAQQSTKLKLSFIIAMVMPAFSIRLLRRLALAAVRIRNRQRLADYGTSLKKIVEGINA